MQHSLQYNFFIVVLVVA